MVRNVSFLTRLARQFGGWKHHAGIRIILFALTGLIFYSVFSGSVIMKTYDLEVNTIAAQTIYAPKQIPDMRATAAAEQKAMEEVGPVYTHVQLDHSVLIARILDKLKSLNADEQLSNSDKANVYRLYFDMEYRVFTDRYVQNVQDEPLQQELAIELDRQKYRIPEEVFFKFPMLTDEDIAEMGPVLNQIVTNLTSEPLRNAETARGKVPEMVNASSLNKQLVREISQEIARYVITPTSFFDKTATEQAKEEAKNNVQPIFIEKGDPIIEAGEVITQEDYELLRDNNLLKDHSYWPQLGLIGLVTLLTAYLYMFVRQSSTPIKTDNVQLLMMLLITALNLVMMKIISAGQEMGYASIAYLAPVAAGSMLIAILLDARIGFVSSILFSIAASIMFNQEHPELLFDFRYGFIALAVCTVSVFAIHKASQRSSILRAGMMVSIFACLTLIALKLIEGGDYAVWDLVYDFGFAIASGLLTAVLVIGLLPFFETVFGILSPLKLVELSNPNHPLLRKLLTETPGTYHHSVMVANLSEAAAEAIGANGLLCRVGSFYHDIGKTRRPGYFIENQSNMENPHDHIDPYLSKSIIIAHARDGAEMLREYKMPKLICDIAEQHHGTSLLSYFYHKALKIAEEKGEQDTVKEEDFRYPGPKAQNKEAAIVGIADSVEAAVRSMRNPTMEQIDAVVDKIVKSRLDDQQFNECDLTMKELDVIANTLKKTLIGIFHSRIEYPELRDDKTAAADLNAPAESSSKSASN